MASKRAPTTTLPKAKKKKPKEVFANLAPRTARGVAVDPSLPVLAARDEILAAVKAHATVLLVGETGSGKSTQVPRFLVEAGLGGGARGARVCVTQPRRVAVLTVCQRVADERGCAVGEAVGYAMRFERQVSPATAVKFATDGLVIRECLRDPQLSDYACVVVDEAHERALHTDVLCGLVRRAARARRASPRPLRVLLMSATLDVAAFSGFFDDAAVVRVPGRAHPVDVFYTAAAVDDYAEAAVACCLQLHGDAACGGDVLVFMPGEQEIRELVHILDDALRGAAPSLVVPLYGALPREDQLRAFAPAPGRRKFVVATTIAETSVTIGGVRHVVDPGLVKARATSTAGFESLKLAPTSKAQARQRAGRAGREAPGRCYRLYPEASWAALADDVTPEILRCDLASVVLQLKALGVDRPEAFDYVSKPPRAALLRALETLHAVGALDDAGALTACGARLAKLPLAPVLAKALDGAADDDRYAPGAEAVLTVVAVVAASDHGVFATPSRSEEADDAIRARDAFEDVSGDLLTARNAYDACARESTPANRGAWCRRRYVSATAMHTAFRIRAQLAGLFPDGAFSRDAAADADARRAATLDCLAGALCSCHAALRDPHRRCFRAARQKVDVFVHPTSVLHGRNPPPDALVYTSSVLTTKLFVRGVLAVDAAALPRLAPHLFSTKGA